MPNSDTGATPFEGLSGRIGIMGCYDVIQLVIERIEAVRVDHLLQTNREIRQVTRLVWRDHLFVDCINRVLLRSCMRLWAQCPPICLKNSWVRSKSKPDPDRVILIMG